MPPPASAMIRIAGLGGIGLPAASMSSVPLNAWTLAVTGVATAGRASAVAVPVPSLEAAGQAEGPVFSSFDSRHFLNADGLKRKPVNRSLIVRVEREDRWPSLV